MFGSPNGSYVELAKKLKTHYYSAIIALKRELDLLVNNPDFVPFAVKG